MHRAIASGGSLSHRDISYRKEGFYQPFAEGLMRTYAASSGIALPEEFLKTVHGGDQDEQIDLPRNLREIKKILQARRQREATR